MRISNGSRFRAAFTLLELVLTLAMSVVLMALIGGALRFYAREMTTRNLDVRQTQLAAALMQIIADDLRSTLHGDPADMAPLEALLQSAAPSLAGNAAALGGAPEGLDDGQPELGPDEADSEAVVDDAGDLFNSTTLLQTPGLIGDASQIQIDVSQLPRLEEYSVLFDESNANLDDVPSDLKTVAYFVQPSGSTGGVEDAVALLIDDESQSGSIDSGGLVRRSLDRSATAYASSNGSLASLNASGDLLAPEVLAIEFAYWNGIDWLPSWNSDEAGELPAAVQITLTMNDMSTSDQTTMRTFTHTVRLPLARMIDEEDAAETATEAEVEG